MMDDEFLDDDLDDQIAEFLYEVWTPAATKDDLDDQIAEFLYEVWTPAATIVLGVQSSSRLSATFQTSCEQQTSRKVP